MKDLGWTAFFALLFCVVVVYYLGKDKNGAAVMVHDEYVESEASMSPTGGPEVNEENLDFYAKPSSKKTSKEATRESERVRKSSEESSSYSTVYPPKNKEAKRENEYKSSKVETSYATTATTAKQDAARRLNEKAISAEKKLAAEKKRNSSSYVSSEKKLKNALKEEDISTANKAAGEMEEELGVELKFAPSKPGEKLPDNPFHKKRN
ncbi:MAG: hypothetical protein IPG32_10495 [Saprospirales bacterium]|nr:hypothetical protein [Saprospirales bacterium]